MNKNERKPSLWIGSRTAKVALPTVFLGVLSACGAGTDDASEDAAVEQATSRPSVGAAELSNDGVNSISFAQAVAAGVIERPATEAATEPTAAAANPDVENSNSGNPLAVIPTSNSTDAVVSGNSPLVILTEQTSITEPESELITQIPDNTSGPAPAPGEVPDIDSQPTVDEPAQSSGSSGNEAIARQFSSATTTGFVGEVLADTIKINWTADPAARGYNVYRQAKYITTVFGTEYIDEDVFDSDYYYEIQAFDFSDKLYYIATGLTVSARTLGRTDPDAPAPNADLLQDYQLVFSDEFNGNQLDSSKWNTSYLWGTDLVINSEEQYYVDILKEPDFGYNPFTFDGNHLTINSIKTPDQLASKALNQPYLSGVITSYDAFKFTYGYIETRAKVSYGRGYWPAFWLLNAYYVDDKPEIDIMEFIGQDQDVVYHTYHYFDSAGVLRSTKSKPTPGIDYTSDFHTYAAEWKPGTIIFYVDGIERHRINDAKVSQQDMYVIANTALGGWWAGSPDSTTPFPGKYTLDYIRVYQKTTPFNDNVLFNDGITSIPYADDIPGQASPNHRPTKEDWPAGYPDGL